MFLDLVVAEYSAGGLSARPEYMYLATREAYRARHINGAEHLPEWASFRILRASVFELIRRTAGPRVARALADRYHQRSGDFPQWGPPTD